MRNWTILFLFFLPFADADLLISEIHPNPLEDESLNEWIELFNNGSSSINLSGAIFSDSADNDTIEGGLFNGEGTILGPLSYAILTDESTRVYENFNVSLTALHLYIDDASLGNGLSNSGENISIRKNGTLLSFASYGGADPGLSLTFLNGSYVPRDPSAGYDSLGILEDGCDYQVQIVLNGSRFTRDGFSWKMIATRNDGSSTNISASATISDFFGEIHQRYTPFRNASISRQRTSSTFSPNLDEGLSYLLSADIETDCEDIQSENDHDERVFSILGERVDESSLSFGPILDLGQDNGAQFGSTIRASLTAYKGNTTKESIALWIEDGKEERLTKQSRISLTEQFTNNKLTIPLQIIPNCNEKFDGGRYTLVAEGLDSRAEKEIRIDGLSSSLCANAIEEEKEESEKKATSSDFSAALKSLPSYENGKESIATLRLENNNEEEVRVILWSYIYKGSKPYSGERESNKKTLTLSARSVSDIELSNTPTITEEGEYRVKFLIQPSTRKTPIDITEDILVKNRRGSLEDDEQVQSVLFDEPQEQTALISEQIARPSIIYESSSSKAESFIPFFLIFALTSFVLVLIWKR